MSHKSQQMCMSHKSQQIEMKTLKGKNLIKYLQPNRKAEGSSESQILLHFI